MWNYSQVWSNNNDLNEAQYSAPSVFLLFVTALERLKETLYQEEDPAQVYYKETTLKVVQEQNQYSLELYLPGIPKDKIQLSKTGDELNITIGNHRRNLVLPQALAALQPSGAKMDEDYLKIRFADIAKV